LRRHEIEPALGLAAEHLHERLLWSGASAHELGEAAIAQALGGARVHVATHDLVGDDRPLGLVEPGQHLPGFADEPPEGRLEVHTFWPLITKRSPSRTARVVSDARSLPAPGSLMPRHADRSPCRIGMAYRSICASLPKSKIDGATIPRPCGFVVRATPASVSS